MRRSLLLCSALSLACTPDTIPPTAPDLATGFGATGTDFVETDLGGLGGNGGRAEGVNTAGDVVGGMRNSSGALRAFLWTPTGGLTDLGTLGGPAALAQTINDRGDVAGWATLPSGARHAFLWTAGTGMQDLSTMGGLLSEVHRINQLGVMVGEGLTAAGQNHALIIYPGGAPMDLGTLGGTYSRADGINELNQVVGRSTTGTGLTHAFVWSAAGGMTDIGTLGGSFSAAVAIDNLGRVSGHAERPDGQLHAFLWTPQNGMTDLGTLGGTFSRAWAINALGHISGHAADAAGTFHPFLWTPESGMQSADTGFGYAFWMNDLDQLAGASGEPLPNSAGTEIVVWTPVWSATRLPSADFEVSCTDRACGFSDLSTDPDGQVALWRWDFGDGATAEDPAPAHTYGPDGAYTVTLVVGDDRGAASLPSTRTVIVTGGPSAPTAGFSVLCTQLACQFTDTSVDLDGQVVAWSWRFGDGGTSSAQHPAHTYPAPGTWTVELVVTDDTGLAGPPATRDVTVSLFTLTVVGTYTPATGPRAMLTWSGASGDRLDVLRNGSRIGTTRNDGELEDTTLPRMRGTYVYRLCEVAPGGACSPEAAVTF
jgi:probable HAF family extracellular repeat protein